MVGCDYSSKAIYLAVVNNQSVLNTSSIKIPEEQWEKKTAFDILQKILNAYYDLYTSDIWIERPWVNGKLFPLSGLMLMRSATYVEIAAMQTHMVVNFVEPLTWRKRLYGIGNPKDPKAKAIEYVEANLGYEVPTFTERSKLKNHNLAEAACIGIYGLLEK